MSSKYAYITMATSKNYLPGLMAMYLSLKQTGTKIPLYAMLPQRLAEDEVKPIANLKQKGEDFNGRNEEYGTAGCAF